MTTSKACKTQALMFSKFSFHPRSLWHSPVRAAALDMLTDNEHKCVALVALPMTTMAKGMPVLTAGRAAQAAENLAKCHKAVETGSSVFFLVEKLEFLRRGGRSCGAQALLGNISNIKPILELRNDSIEPAGKVHTKQKAF